MLQAATYSLKYFVACQGTNRLTRLVLHINVTLYIISNYHISCSYTTSSPWAMKLSYICIIYDLQTQ